MTLSGVFVFIWTVLLGSIDEGLAILCYECETLDSDDCGPVFKPRYIDIVSCEHGELCALQRQRNIPRVKQIAAISRTCYSPGTIPGLDSTTGCRRWTNSANFTALYCFCDTDLCNTAATRLYQSLPLRILVLVFSALRTK